MKSETIFVTPRCPIRTTLELVGGKWKLLILYQLFAGGPLRLSQLKALIPDISEKMLVQELKKLVDSELAHRQNWGEVPPRVEYSITNKGKHAMPLVKAMGAFAQHYTGEQG